MSALYFFFIILLVVDVTMPWHLPRGNGNFFKDTFVKDTLIIIFILYLFSLPLTSLNIFQMIYWEPVEMILANADASWI